MNHTPGPWTAEFVGSGGTQENPVDVYEIIAAGRVRVAEYASGNDAPLIAAAPDLLVALEKLYRLHCGLDSWHEDAMSNAWASAIAAIAKAKGEA